MVNTLKRETRKIHEAFARGWRDGKRGALGAQPSRRMAEQRWPYLTDEFQFSRDWMIDTLGRIFDIKGPHAPVIEALNMPASFVILDRVVWGMSAILGKLEARGPFRGMMLEYIADGDPVTDIGAAEAAWRAARSPS